MLSLLSIRFPHACQLLWPLLMLFGLAACGPTQAPAGSSTPGVTLAQVSSVPPTPLPTHDSVTAQAFYSTTFERRPDNARLTELGRQLFAEKALSASGRQACASCHDPAHGYASPNRLAVQRGGADGRAQGLRNVPSLKYQQSVPPFTEHYQETDGNDSEDQGPAGGRGWDGRAASAHEQALAPLLSPFEMANEDGAAVVRRLRASASAARFVEAFGPTVFDDSQRALRGLLLALEVFQQSPPDFYPYSSKYDAWLRRQVQLSPAEQRGLEAFNDPARGNCAQCHPSAIRHGGFPQFTDHGLVAIGVPRNRALPANGDAAWYDLGLCGPVRTDLGSRPEYCGLFKTPSLRNVALRGRLFHNGVYGSLGQAVRFYVDREHAPAQVYPRDRAGAVQRYDDLPAAYRDNLNVEAPFDRGPGDAPALTAREIRDLVAFLKTLTDGWAPAGAAHAAGSGRSTPARTAAR